MPGPTAMMYESTWARLTQRCVDHDGDCWVGLERTRDRCGYQQINMYVKGLQRPVKLLELDHECQEPACRNPDHLQPLTVREHRQVTLDRRHANGPH